MLSARMTEPLRNSAADRTAARLSKRKAGLFQASEAGFSVRGRLQENGLQIVLFRGHLPDRTVHCRQQTEQLICQPAPLIPHASFNPKLRNPSLADRKRLRLPDTGDAANCGKQFPFISQNAEEQANLTVLSGLFQIKCPDQTAFMQYKRPVAQLLNF